MRLVGKRPSAKRFLTIPNPTDKLIVKNVINNIRRKDDIVIYLCVRTCREHFGRKSPENSVGEMPLNDPVPDLYWDATYAIALALIKQHPEQEIDKIGLEELAALVEALPGFNDDPAIVTDRILEDILIVWYEEASTL